MPIGIRLNRASQDKGQIIRIGVCRMATPLVYYCPVLVLSYKHVFSNSFSQVQHDYKVYLRYWWCGFITR